MAGMYPDNRTLTLDGEKLTWPGVGENGKFTDGDLNDPSVAPSFIPAETLNLIIDNLAGFITELGKEPNNKDGSQIAQAFKEYMSRKTFDQETALENEALKRAEEDAKLQELIDAINAVIPMQTSATNQLADKNFVAQKISEIVADSPAAFDTLKEIADWIESHSDSAAAMNSQINENKTNISTLTTKTSKLSADGATYSGNAASATKLKTARNINGVPFDGTKDITLVVSANATHFGTCSNAASTQVKSVSIAGFALVAGARVSVLFSNGNTAGSLSGNSITQASAPMLNVQSTGAKPIKVGNAYAGPNFVNAGEVHDFVYDGSAWNDVTASVIFKGINSNGNYVKHRDGLIEQWRRTSNAGNMDVTYALPIPFSAEILHVSGTWQGTGSQHTQSGSSIRYIPVSLSQIRFVNSIYYDDKTAGFLWYAAGY